MTYFTSPWPWQYFLAIFESGDMRRHKSLSSSDELKEMLFSTTFRAQTIAAFHTCCSLVSTNFIFPLFMKKFWPGEVKVAWEFTSFNLFKCLSTLDYTNSRLHIQWRITDCTMGQVNTGFIRHQPRPILLPWCLKLCFVHFLFTFY